MRRTLQRLICFAPYNWRMEHDPWEDTLSDVNPDDMQPEDDIPLTPLNQVRRSLGLPHEEVSSQPPHTELGEAYGNDEDFKATLQAIAYRVLGRKPAVAYNPGSGEHVTLARAFPGSRVIFADVSGYVETAFIEHNRRHPEEHYEFYRADMHDFRLPEDVRADITLLLNAGYMTEDELDRVTALDGLVIVNDWHGTAQYMLERCPSYNLRTHIAMDQPENDLYVFRRQLDIATQR